MGKPMGPHSTQKMWHSKILSEAHIGTKGLCRQEKNPRTVIGDCAIHIVRFSLEPHSPSLPPYLPHPRPYSIAPARSRTLLYIFLFVFTIQN